MSLICPKLSLNPTLIQISTLVIISTSPSPINLLLSYLKRRYYRECYTIYFVLRQGSKFGVEIRKNREIASDLQVHMHDTTIEENAIQYHILDIFGGNIGGFTGIFRSLTLFTEPN